MTVMEQALKAAGVPMRTVPERIWHYVLEHPKTTCFDMSSVLKIPFDRTATIAGLLVRRKMLIVSKEARRSHGARGDVRSVNVYTVPASMKFYNVLPLGAPLHPRKGQSKAANAAAAAKAQPVPTLVPMEAPPPKVPMDLPVPMGFMEEPKIDIDKLTVGEAKSLYEKLHRMFGK